MRHSDDIGNSAYVSFLPQASLTHSYRDIFTNKVYYYYYIFVCVSVCVYVCVPPRKTLVFYMAGVHLGGHESQ